VGLFLHRQHLHSGCSLCCDMVVCTVKSTTPRTLSNVIPVQDQTGSNVFTLTAPYASPTTAATPSTSSQTQDFISTGTMWSPIASFVLTTTQIPVRFEANASPVIIGQTNAGGTSAVSGASQKVLLETPIDAVTADIWRGFIQYKPLTPSSPPLTPVKTDSPTWTWDSTGGTASPTPSPHPECECAGLILPPAVRQEVTCVVESPKLFVPPFQ